MNIYYHSGNAYEEKLRRFLVAVDVFTNVHLAPGLAMVRLA